MEILSDNQTAKNEMNVAACDEIPNPDAKSDVAGTRGERLHSIGKY